MHPARLFHDTDKETLLERIRQVPFALVIGVSEGRPEIAHTPVLVAQDGKLLFHLSRANPLCEVISRTGSVQLVFTGPHAYISPDWYEIPDQVPTWNYLSVEAEGPVETLDEDGARRVLDLLSDQFEAALTPKPIWTREKMTTGKFDTMVRAIIAFELTPTRLEGTTKLSQNKPLAVRIAAGLACQSAKGPGSDTDSIGWLMKDME